MEKLKAYEVCCDWAEESIVHIFAKSGIVARREGAEELNLEFQDISYCRRAPSLDRFSPGPVPLRYKIESLGWWAECWHSYERIDSDTPNPLYIGTERVFRNPYAWLADVEERVGKRLHQEEGAKLCREKFPFSSFVRRCQVGQDYTDTIEFRFPNCRGMHARWVVGADRFTVSQVDEATINALQIFGGDPFDPIQNQRI